MRTHQAYSSSERQLRRALRGTVPANMVAENTSEAQFSGQQQKVYGEHPWDREPEEHHLAHLAHLAHLVTGRPCSQSSGHAAHHLYLCHGSQTTLGTFDLSIFGSSLLCSLPEETTKREAKRWRTTECKTKPHK